MNASERTKREAKILAECEARGIRVSQRGIGYHLQGRTCDITTSDLSLLRIDDLAPPRSDRDRR